MNHLYEPVLARNCLASTLNYIVMQMRKTNREKGYWERGEGRGFCKNFLRQKTCVGGGGELERALDDVFGIFMLRQNFAKVAKILGLSH